MWCLMNLIVIYLNLFWMNLVDDLRTILQKNQSIDFDATDTCDVKEPVVNARLPKEWKTPGISHLTI